MRFLVLLLSLALLAAGPTLYLTKGRDARRQRIEALEALERHRLEMQAEAARGPAPSLEAIDRLRNDLAERRSQRSSVTARVLAYRSTPAPNEETLRALAKTIALDAPRMEPLLRPMPQGELGEMRRHVIHAVLRALERSGAGAGSGVLDLKIAREPRLLELDPGFRALRVDLVLRADATLLTRVSESLLEVHSDEPFSDLTTSTLSVPDAKDLLNPVAAPANAAGTADGATPGAEGSQSAAGGTPAVAPPLVLTLALDYLVAEVP